MRKVASFAALLALGVASPAAAQIDLFSQDVWSGVADLRLTAVNGERSWTDGALGKTRFSGGNADFRIRPALAEVDLVWKPRLNWNLGATVVGQYQPVQIRPLGVSEAFITYKPTPKGPFRQQIRAGLYYPAISQEHTAGAWLVADSITPSAINSWVGTAAARTVIIGASADTGYQNTHGWIYDPNTGRLWAGSFSDQDQPFPRP